MVHIIKMVVLDLLVVEALLVTVVEVVVCRTHQDHLVQVLLVEKEIIMEVMDIMKNLMLVVVEVVLLVLVVLMHLLVQHLKEDQVELVFNYLQHSDSDKD